jgi:hypothetical protein
LKNFIKTTFFLAIGLLLVWLVVRNLTDSDKSEILLSFKKANYSVILLVALIGLMSHVSRAIRWQTLLEPLGKKPSLINTIFAVLVGYLANLAVPRLGEVTRCGVLKQYEEIPFESAFGTVIVERIIDTILLLIVSIITIVWQFSILSSTLQSAMQTISGKSAGNSIIYLVVIFIAIIILFVTLFVVFKTKIKNSALYLKIATTLKGFLEGIKTVSKLKRPWVFIFHSFFIWVLYLLAIYIGFKSLPETAHLGLGAALAILFFGTFAFIVVQGGIGAYQIIVQNTLVIYGISANIGYAVGWLLWGTQTITMVLCGVLSLILLPIINNKKQKNGLAENN